MQYYSGDEASCIMFALREKYNLTLRNSQFDMDRGESYLGHILWGVIFNIRCDVRAELQIYRLDETKFDILLVSRRPGNFIGFTAFLFPFQGLTWCAIAVSGLAVLAMLVLKSVSCEVKISEVFEALTSNLLRVVGLFFNQTGSGEVFKKSGVTLIAWGCACLILSNCYSKGIYFSVIAARSIIPTGPDTIDALVESDFSILTMSAYTTVRNGVAKKGYLIRDVVIPELLYSFGHYSKRLERLLSRVNRKLVFVDDNDQIAIHSVKEIFAVLDTPRMLEFIGNQVVAGDQVVVKNRGGTLFRKMTASLGLRNFFSPQIQKTLVRLKESGISGRWKSLDVEKANMIGIRGLHWKTDGMQTGVEPGKLGFLLPVLIFCGGMVLAGGVAFLCERIKFLWFIKSKCCGNDEIE